MQFYTKQHPFYCGIDLHARTMYLCILDQAGETLLHRNMTATPEALLKAIAPYREQIVLATVDCADAYHGWMPAGSIPQLTPSGLLASNRWKSSVHFLDRGLKPRKKSSRGDQPKNPFRPSTQEKFMSSTTYPYKGTYRLFHASRLICRSGLYSSSS